MAELPAGTVTFLFTDIEGSTRLLQQLGDDRYGQVLADQRRILRAAFDRFGGREVDTQGDAFFASFPRASDAVAAAAEIQRALADHVWPEGAEVRVRMGLHTGEPQVGAEGYVGMDVHRAARIAHIGHGGQVLLSEATAALLKRDLPEGMRLRDLGSYQLKDLRTPWQNHQLVVEGLPAEFPELNAERVRPPGEAASIDPAPPPPFLHESAPKAARDPPTFVARLGELERLEGLLSEAMAGRFRVAFITGEAGEGKTALLDAFARRALAAHPDVVVVSGACRAYTGAGDPYLPFRDALKMLGGEVEGPWAAGSISTDHARRLWALVPHTARAMLSQGNGLVGALLSGEALLSRLEAVEGEGAGARELRALVERGRQEGGGLQGEGLFDQYAGVLAELSAHHPLVIALDDLQWADQASLNLLFHLGHRLAGNRILLLGAYRPEEVALGRDGQRHPLEKVLAEIKRVHGDRTIDLGAGARQEGRAFVDALLDSQPNRLGTPFREALLGHTDGHALFTIELLRDLQERGDLVRDADGRWVEGPALDWEQLPGRVESVIEERIDRLEAELRDILTVASVEGEDFTAQVVARVREVDARGLVRQLSGELDKKHRLVGERGSQAVRERRLFLYRFRHRLFQQHLYNGLGDIERQLLHGEVGEALEALYGKGAEEVAPQLAWHFRAAGEPGRALPYLLQAGDRARVLYANQEAIAHYEGALACMQETGEDDRAARTWMKLGLTCHNAFDFERAQHAYMEGFRLLQQPGGVTAPGAAPAGKTQTLRVLFYSPATLDPSFAGEVHSEVCAFQLFSGLVELTPELDILPDVAIHWEVLDAGRRYVFHLRESVRWSDGRPVTAGDFAFAWRRLLDPESPDEFARFLFDVRGAQAFHRGETADPAQVGVRTPDDQTLVVELERPAGYFLQLLAHTVAFPVPEHAVRAHGQNWTDPETIVTNGPFRLAAYEPGERIRFTRNPDYHGRFTGNVGQVEMRLNRAPDPRTYPWYRDGEIDLIHPQYLTEDQFETALHTHGGDFVTGPSASLMYLGFPVRQPPWDDPRVRRALACAVDVQTLIAGGRTMWGFPATGGFIPMGVPGHNPALRLPFDPAGARTLLAEAGYPGGAGFPSLPLLAPNNRKPMAEAIAAGWREALGISVRVQSHEWEPYLHILEEDPGHPFLLGWTAAYPDPDDFLRFGSWRDRTGWRDPAFERLIERARRLLDQGERLKLYAGAERLMMENTVVIPLAYGREQLLVKPWVTRIPLSPLSNTFYKDIVIDSAGRERA